MPTELTNSTPPRPPGIYRALAVVMHPLERLLGLGCRTFTRLASARLDRALTLRERIGYALHWLMCSICRQQAARGQCLHELLKLGHGEKLSEATLSAEAKAKLRERVQAELNLEN
ncbi:MAG: hypothetical protein RLZZ350_1353 [Verrucomicrobiota bacterium]|jgi:hypothetical protein